MRSGEAAALNTVSYTHLDVYKRQGIYVPFWLFGCDSHANMQYQATKIFSWSDRDYEYTRTDHYLLLRSGDMSFDKVPVDGSAKMADDYMEAIEPYDYSVAQEFDTAYLSGYLADKYDQDAEASKPRANPVSYTHLDVYKRQNQCREYQHRPQSVQGYAARSLWY